MTLDDIAEITVQQEPVARFFDIRLGLSGFPGETESSYCTESAIPKYSRRVSTPSGCRSEPVGAWCSGVPSQTADGDEPGPEKPCQCDPSGIVVKRVARQPEGAPGWVASIGRVATKKEPSSGPFV